MTKELNILFTHKNGNVSKWKPIGNTYEGDETLQLESYTDPDGESLIPKFGIILPDRAYIVRLVYRLEIYVVAISWATPRFFEKPITQGFKKLSDACEWAIEKLVEALAK